MWHTAPTMASHSTEVLPLQDTLRCLLTLWLCPRYSQGKYPISLGYSLPDSLAKYYCWGNRPPYLCNHLILKLPLPLAPVLPWPHDLAIMNFISLDASSFKPLGRQFPLSTMFPIPFCITSVVFLFWLTHHFLISHNQTGFCPFTYFYSIPWLIRELGTLQIFKNREAVLFELTKTN